MRPALFTEEARMHLVHSPMLGLVLEEQTRHGPNPLRGRDRKAIPISLSNAENHMTTEALVTQHRVPHPEYNRSIHVLFVDESEQ